MQTVVITVHLMLVLAIIGVVLLQRSEGGGLGAGGSSGGFMSSRGTANLLTRTTAFLAVGFFATSLFLSWLAGYNRTPASIINPAAVPSQSGAPSAPISGNILDNLKAREGVPSGPQVPQSK